MKTRIFLAVLLIAAGLAAGAWWGEEILERSLDRPMQIARTSTLSVTPGMTLTRLSHELVQRGWIATPYPLIFEARRSGRANHIQAGEFEVPPGTTPRQLLDRLVAGQVRQYSLTLVEGWTFRQIMQAVGDDPHLEHRLSSSIPARVMAEIGYAGYFAEGRFFPDTYHFPAGTTDVDFLRRACQTMRAILNDEWQSRLPGLPYASPYQALIMASIIEKETAVPDERTRIAGVFVRRLERGIKLQTDPTLIYALGASFDGDIRNRDFSVDSPFNTYRYAGLPPTPIASPGRASIHAAMQPDDSSALYFVSRGDGTHVFSDTLEAHNAAVRKYQLKRSH